MNTNIKIINNMKAIQVATYLMKLYREQFHEEITEMKLHKLLYFSQRESYMQLGRPIFDDKFQAWRYGPVILAVRDLFKAHMLNQMPCADDVLPFENVFKVIMTEYAPKDTWSLSDMTHAESSWKNARIGLNPSDLGSNVMNDEDIRKDAFRAQLRAFELSLFNA